MRDALAAALARDRLTLFGGFDLEPGEDGPDGPTGRPAQSIALIGNAGGAFWSEFTAWVERQPDVMADPLDTWSTEVIGRVGETFGARLIMPNERPFPPFQQWARRAARLEASPLGILIHPEYGLWHAFRGALAFETPLGFPQVHKPIHLCDACHGKPCLSACPVEAFAGPDFAYGRCVAHVKGARGGACRAGGCLARNACPYGLDYRYPAEMQGFIMRAYAR